ncbi:MAG: gamma-glutamyl-gamma-aminobutyrate hydrolase family protein [Muribaculaceae bacterium]|nr:gamma-glutamyl-gamma-aminobutyrate hydrolase family protein [Muribaculaceae bacterium]
MVFLGGGDVCPTLFATPQPWHGIEAETNHDATRDVSEFLTMAYCLDHDIPILGLCRGMQLLGVVSGAPLIQDLPTYYTCLGKTDHYVHRSDYDYEGNRHYSPHDVVVTNRRSLLWSIVHTDTIHGAPSWHHQAVGDVTGTPLRVTGVAEHDGITVIEAIERPDKRWVLGVQYHPETAVRKHMHHEDDEARFMSLNEGLAYFRALLQACRANLK